MQATGGAEREPANGQKRRWQPRASACVQDLLELAPLHAEAVRHRSKRNEKGRSERQHKNARLDGAPQKLPAASA
jgi:hypothetical protein